MRTHSLLAGAGLFVLTVMAAGAVWGAEEKGTTVLPATVESSTVAPGAMLKITYNWDAVQPLGQDYRAFVHFRKEGSNKMAFQGDHGLPAETTSADWKGRISYEKTVKVPDNVANGKYIIAVGFWNKSGRPVLTAGEGVADLGGNSYQVGSVTVDNGATTTILPATVEPSTVVPGAMLKIGFNWLADKPSDQSYRAFVHIRKEGDNKMAFQADHAFPADTASDNWKGPIQYEKTVRVPTNLEEGKYVIAAGMWAEGKKRPVLNWGEGVTAAGGNSYIIGSFTVAK